MIDFSGNVCYNHYNINRKEWSDMSDGREGLTHVTRVTAT